MTIAPHVLLERRRCHRDACLGEHLLRVGPDRHLGRTRDEDDVGVRQVGDPGDRLGLPGATMISNEFVANTSGSAPLLPASVSLVMLFWSAEA